MAARAHFDQLSLVQFRSVYHMFYDIRKAVWDLWFDVTLQSDVRKVPVETFVSAQLYWHLIS